MFVNFDKVNFASMFAKAMSFRSQKLWIKDVGNFCDRSSWISTRPQQ